MVKTTTLKQESSLPGTSKVKKLSKIANEFGASEFTIQNILNYSKSLQVINLSKTSTVFGVMN